MSAAAEGLCAGARTGRFLPAVLYTLCGSLALYPLLAQFIAPVLAASFGVAAMSVLLRLAANGFRVPVSFIGTVWTMYGTVYAVWFTVGILHGNHLPYIVQDSFGFLLYLGVLPVLYLYIRLNGLEARFQRFIEGCCIAIGAISLAVFLGFYALLGEITSESMFLANALIMRLGLSWVIDHNSGMLGLYTYTAHLLLLGMAISLHRYTRTQHRRELRLMLLYLAGIVLDGHRALLITALLQLLIAAPRLLGNLKPRQRLQVVAATTLVVATLVAVNFDWILQRFEFSDEDVSTAERYAQVPALLDKIAENPALGGGFGTVAAYIRSPIAPYSYEVDFLATFMKLGAFGALLYFGTYLAVVLAAWRSRGSFGLFLTSAGLPFFFYMGSNGSQAMSTDSAVFHIFIFLLIVQTPLERMPRKPHRLALRGIPA
jgi:hypothetical protein